MCNKSLNEAFGEKLFSFMLLNFRYFDFVTPPPCVQMHLWQCNPLCLGWGLWVKRSLHVQ